MTNPNSDDAQFDSANHSMLDTALHAHLLGGAQPDDGGFSLRVMAALPPAPPSPRQRRAARWIRWARWTAVSGAACATALLFGANGLPQDGPHALAGLALMGLLIFWSIPSRWNQG